MIIAYYKDPFWPTRIQWKVGGVFSWLTWPNLNNHYGFTKDDFINWVGEKKLSHQFLQLQVFDGFHYTTKNTWCYWWSLDYNLRISWRFIYHNISCPEEFRSAHFRERIDFQHHFLTKFDDFCSWHDLSATCWHDFILEMLPMVPPP